MRGRLFVLVAALLVFNLGIMALDALLLPELGGVQVAPVNPAPRSGVQPALRAPNQLDQFLRGLGIRPIGMERPQPDLRPIPNGPRVVYSSRPQSSLRPFSLHQSGLGGLFLHLVALLTLLSLSIILTFFLPDRLRVMRDMLGGPWSHKLRILAIGIIGYLAALLLAALMIAEVSGIIYAMLVIAILTALTAVGVTTVALAIGRWLTFRSGAEAQPLAQLLVGMLVIFPLTILPYFLGWAAAGFAASFGLGVILLTRLGGGTPWTLEVLQ